MLADFVLLGVEDSFLVRVFFTPSPEALAVLRGFLTSGGSEAAPLLLVVSSWVMVLEVCTNGVTIWWTWVGTVAPTTVDKFPAAASVADKALLCKRLAIWVTQLNEGECGVGSWKVLLSGFLTKI